MSERVARRRLTAAAWAIGVGMLVSTSVTPATAQAAEHSTPLVGGFGLGDGLEAAVDERAGALRFTAPAGGLDLAWDSRGSGVDRFGLGAGWSWGLDVVDPVGGVHVLTASGGRHAADATTPSGLAGYGTADVAFEQRSGTLPNRAERPPGTPEHVAFAFVLHALGGTETYFSADGDPVARFDRHGDRMQVTYPDGATIGSTFDAHGRRTGGTDTAGTTTRLTHTPDGLIERAVQYAADGGELASVSYEYDTFRRISRLNRGNGVDTAYTFTAASEIASEHTTDASGRTIAHREYAYDTHGNLLSREDAVAPNGSEEPGEAGVRSTTYAYDARDRLIHSAVHSPGSGALVRETSYRLSASGDVLTETTDAADVAATSDRADRPEAGDRRVTTRSYAYGPRGELVARTETVQASAGTHSTHGDQSWDSAGNLRRSLDGTLTEYDAANRPITERTPDGSVTDIRYWADGTRRDRTTAHVDGVSETTGYYWDGSELVNDTHAGTDQAGAGTASYLLGTGRHARTTQRGDHGQRLGGHAQHGVDTTYSITDRHGSITETTDDTGTTTRLTGYSDYGAPEATGPTPTALDRDPFGFAGEYTDERGRQLLGARTYDPKTLQFTSRDEADRHNRYAYADLNPIMNVDPTGRTPAPDAWHPVMLGLGLLFSVAIGVASFAAAAIPGTLGTFGVVTAVGGLLGSTYSIVVSTGGLLAASGTPMSAGARDFFASDLAWAIEVVVTGSGLAAGFLGVKAYPQLKAWFSESSLWRAWRRPQMIEMQPIGGPPQGVRLDAPTLLAEWSSLAEAAEAGPMAAMTGGVEQLIVRTAWGLYHDAFATVSRQTVTLGSRHLGGLRAWLATNHGVPPELSALIYQQAGLSEGLFGQQALASRLEPLVGTVLAQHRQFLPGLPGDHLTRAGRMEGMLDSLHKRIRSLLGMGDDRVSEIADPIDAFGAF